MKIDKKWILIAALASSGSCFAHGTKHQDEATVDIVDKEQLSWGIAADPEEVTRIIEISMTDNMRFIPDAVTVSLGEKVKFIIKNKGQLLHEFVIGTTENNDDHAALMMKFPNMEHSEPYMSHVAPGEEGVIYWTFNNAGVFDYACLIAGHYQAGMVGKITVKSS